MRLFYTCLRIPINRIKQHAYSSTTTKNGEIPTSKIRNIGIIAHIDAGKTTSTERFLYYSGYTKRIGNVDQGSTVTDYLPQERERGITIQSACIPLGWKDHRLNLIDTPGHVDFTIEVERCLRVLDGAVVILDGVAGVEAQTENVWSQANKNHIPRILFVNKMDREGSALMKTVLEIEKKLTGWGKPLVTQWPIVLDGSGNVNGAGSGGNSFVGVVDLINMELLDFSSKSTGSVVKKTAFTSGDTATAFTSKIVDGAIEKLYKESISARSSLVEQLAEIDDVLMELFLEENGDHLKVPPLVIKDAIRRQTLTGKICPVLLGAAFRNIGIQPLMDAVVDYLPSPLDCRAPIAKSKKKGSVPIPLTDPRMFALAFKVIQDTNRGPLVFVRVYSGSMEARMSLVNTRNNVKERATKLIQMYADDYEEIPRITAGNIGAITGLKDTKTGDTLTVYSKQSSQNDSIQLLPINIPPPVFFCSIEPTSGTDDKKFELALQSLMREDPSIHISVDPDTNQTLLGGMGELHLEISVSRLKENYKIDVRVGKVMIGYREVILHDTSSVTLAPETFVYDRQVFGKRAWASVELKLDVCHEVEDLQEFFIKNDNTKDDTDCRTLDGNEIIINLNNITGSSSKSTKASGKVSNRHQKSESGQQQTINNFDLLEIEDALKSGVQGALSRGPFLGFPFTNLSVTISNIQAHPTNPEITTLSSIRAAAFAGTQEAIKKASWVSKKSDSTTTDSQSSFGKLGRLVEPIMNVRIRVPEKYVGNVSRDIGGSRNGQIVEMRSEDEEGCTVGKSNYQIIEAKVPLSSMIGYSTHIRSITQGTGNFSMQMIGYGVVNASSQKDIAKDVRGY